MRIKMLQQVGDHAKGAIVPVEDAVGKRYVAAGIAEEAGGDGAAALDNLAETIKKSIAAGFEGMGTSAGETTEQKAARFRVDAGEQQADKTKSLADWFQCVGVTGILNDPRREHAFQRLEKAYGSPMSPDFAERFAAAEVNRTGMSMKAALAESSGITGGFTVPTQFVPELLQVQPEDAVMVGLTDDYPMTGVELVMPALDHTTAPTAGNSAFLAGVVMNWTAEAVTRTETEPKFKELRLKANELSGYALASRNVLMDNQVALGQRLTQLFSNAITWYRDYAYLAGDGVGKPQGVIGAAATLSVTRGTSSQVNYIDIVQMYGKLLPQSVKRAFWVMQQSVLQSFLQMKDVANQLVIQPYFPGNPGGPATVRPVMTMLGMPIVTTEKVSTLGTAGDVLLIDPKFYFSGTRQAIEIAASEHYKFLNNQVTYRILFRGDGRPWLDGPITMADATTQVSPFVKLT